MFFRANNLEDHPPYLEFQLIPLHLRGFTSWPQTNRLPTNLPTRLGFQLLLFLTMLSSITFLDLKTVKSQLARGKGNLSNHGLTPISFCTGFQTDSLMNENTGDFQKMTEGLQVQDAKASLSLGRVAYPYLHQISYVSISSLCNLFLWSSKPIHCLVFTL